MPALPLVTTILKNDALGTAFALIVAIAEPVKPEPDPTSVHAMPSLEASTTHAPTVEVVESMMRPLPSGAAS
jgi:hypothetical protein